MGLAAGGSDGAEQVLQPVSGTTGSPTTTPDEYDGHVEHGAGHVVQVSGV